MGGPSGAFGWSADLLVRKTRDFGSRVVVNGTARVTRGAETLTLKENESVSIPLGAAHRLENPGKTPLRLIEVQSGSYLGEDDIVRLDDIYGRT